MLRVVGGRICSAVRSSIIPRAAAAQHVRASHGGPKEADEDFDARYEHFFNRKDISHWEIRKAMNDLAGMDLIPEPKIICAALRACRRLNDYALAVRYIECIKDKCDAAGTQYYPYILQEIGPTLSELGVNTPEELGYDKPELALQDVYDIH